MADIFVSYARSTARQARAVADALSREGYSVWSDDNLPTHRAYAEVIEEQLALAKAVVVIWSAEAIRSQWVRSEADRARGENKLVQLSVDGARLPMPFDQIQCADLSGPAMAHLHPNWAKVLASLADLLGAAPQASAAPRRTSHARATAPLLAVLPFDNLSNDAEMDFFSDGVSEDIIQRLSRGAGLKVIGRTSSFQFRGAHKADAADALGCTHVLDGSIRRAAGRVRVSAHLVETRSRTTLWSDRYDRDIEDIFAVQDEISEQIAAALDHAFDLDTKAVDLGAYDLYLRATPTSDSAEEAQRCIALLELAVERDPDFADAWARLADAGAYRLFFRTGAVPPGPRSSAAMPPAPWSWIRNIPWRSTPCASWRRHSAISSKSRRWWRAWTGRGPSRRRPRGRDRPASRSPAMWAASARGWRWRNKCSGWIPSAAPRPIRWASIFAPSAATPCT